MPRKKQAEKDSLANKPKSGWEILKGKEGRIEAYCREYIRFLSEVKTEREAVSYIKDKASRDKGLVVFDNRGKAVAVCRTGTRPMADGVRIVVAHLDSPRIDLKANPLYEDSELAMLKTHYYGGIKKYQWASLPLGLFGTVIRRDGSAVEVAIGAHDGDPCFVIPDLLPHVEPLLHHERDYYDVVLANHLYEVQVEALDFAQANLKDVIAREQAGVAIPFDELRARVEVSNVEADMIQQRNKLNRSRTALAFWTRAGLFLSRGKTATLMGAMRGWKRMTTRVSSLPFSSGAWSWE
jgi:hypothetical protein